MAAPEPAAESVIVALPDAPALTYKWRPPDRYLRVLPPPTGPAPPRLRDLAMAGHQKYEHVALLLLGAAGLAGIILAFAVF